MIRTNGIGPKVLIEGDKSLAVQRRGQINYLPFWGRVINEGDYQGRDGNQRDNRIAGNHRAVADECGG